MYEQHTKQAILQRMLDASPAELDKRQGSVTYDLLSPAAIELAQLYIELDQAMKYGFAGPEQPSHFLDLRAQEFGLTRRPSVKAQGTLVFRGEEGTIIPMGIVVSTEEETPILFVTTAPSTIAGGTAAVSAVAIEGGKLGNVASGRIKLVTGDLSGIVAVSNAEPFVNGADAESDESLLERYFDRVRRPATSGNVWHYRQWALEVPGVGDVRVFPVWNGNGTVKLALLSDDKRAPVVSIIEAVAALVEERRPVGAQVTVLPAVEVDIRVSARLVLQDGADPDAVKTEFANGLARYLADLAFKESVIRYNRILGLLLDIESVIDFNDLKINGVTGNLRISEDQVAIAGAVSFDVA